MFTLFTGSWRNQQFQNCSGMPRWIPCFVLQQDMIGLACFLIGNSSQFVMEVEELCFLFIQNQVLICVCMCMCMCMYMCVYVYVYVCVYVCMYMCMYMCMCMFMCMCVCVCMWMGVCVWQLASVWYVFLIQWLYMSIYALKLLTSKC